MFTKFKQILKRSPSMIILYNMLADLRAKRRFAGGDFSASAGATHMDADLESSVAYIRRVFDEYLLYGGCSLDELAGLEVLELGPGDNLGVALLFVAGGASRVVCQDKFYSARDPGHERRIYGALRETLGEDDRRRFDEAVALAEDRAVFNEERVKYTAGKPAEEGVAARAFDLIVSRAVLEEIHDVDEVFAIMDGLLRPGGRMWHKVDFRDYGTFSRNGHHPLTFLTIRDWVYDRMARHSAKPNRRLIDYYRGKIEALGYEGVVYPTGVIGAPAMADRKERVVAGVDYGDEAVELVRAIRPRLRPRYRDLPEEDLVVDRAFFVARKPL